MFLIFSWIFVFWDLALWDLSPSLRSGDLLGFYFFLAAFFLPRYGVTLRI